MEPPFHPVIPFLGLSTRDLKSAYYSDAVISIFIAAQFTIGRLWNQPRCPSTDEWIMNDIFVWEKIVISKLKPNEGY